MRLKSPSDVIFNILLQILDDGRLTDNKGMVNFKKYVIMTSIWVHTLLESFEK